MSFVNINQILPCLSVACALFPLSVFSAEQNELSELDYLSDLPVTFSATRLPQTLNEAPASITIIDRRMIDASGAVTIPELFRLVPGMQAYHIATNASAVAYHGMSNKFPSRMEVMIDGRSVYIPLFSAVIWESLPISISDVERIEVIRGTNTVTQGSNAFLGSINIITNSGFSARKNIVKYQQGEFENKTLYSRYSASHELGYYSVSAGITGNEGNRFPSGNTDPYFNRHFTFNTSISPTLLDTFTVNLGINDGYSSVGDIDSGDIGNLTDPKRRDFQTSFQHLTWTHSLPNAAELKISYAHTVNDYSARLFTVAEAAQRLGQPESVAQQFLDANAPVFITAETGNIEQHNVEVTLKQQPTYHSKLISGVAYKADNAKNHQVLNTQEWVKEESVRLFTNWEYTGFTDWTINSGALLEHTSNSSTRVSPRVAANYQLSNQSTIRTSISRAYRMPSLLEANYESVIYIPQPYTGIYGDVYDYEFIANKDLSPEKLDSIDLGLIYKWPDFHSQLATRIYYEKIERGITTSYRFLDPVRAASAPNDPYSVYRSYMNRAEWSNQGIEFQYKYQSEENLKPQIVINYGYIDSNGYRNDGNQRGSTTDVIDRLETRNPMHTASLLTSITLPNALQISLSHYYLSSVRWQEGVKDSEDPNSPYHRTDLKISKAFRVAPQNELSIALIVQNLLDKPYSEFYAGNMFERRTYIQAQLSF